MESRFYIKENRLDEFKTFIRTNTSTVRFLHNPLKEGNQYYIAISLDVKESGKLNELFQKWHIEDNPPKPIKQSFWSLLSNSIGLSALKSFFNHPNLNSKTP
jgi:hypothetical protein